MQIPGPLPYLLNRQLRTGALESIFSKPRGLDEKPVVSTPGLGPW